MNFKKIYASENSFQESHTSYKDLGGYNSPFLGSQGVSQEAKFNSDSVGSEIHSSLSNHCLFRWWEFFVCFSTKNAVIVSSNSVILSFTS